jgi:hypothetical protein
MPKMARGCIYFAQFSDFSVFITQRIVENGRNWREVMSQKLHLIGLTSRTASALLWLTAELGYQATSQALWLSPYCVSLTLLGRTQRRIEEQ